MLTRARSQGLSAGPAGARTRTLLVQGHLPSRPTSKFATFCGPRANTCLVRPHGELVDDARRLGVGSLDDLCSAQVSVNVKLDGGRVVRCARRQLSPHPLRDQPLKRALSFLADLSEVYADGEVRDIILGAHAEGYWLFRSALRCLFSFQTVLRVKLPLRKNKRRIQGLAGQRA